MSELIVKPLQTRCDRRAFLHLTDRIYRDYSNYVPMIKLELKAAIKPGKHPFYDAGEAQFFVAYRDGQPVGRICAYQNHRHNAFHQDKKGFIGSFECINELAVATALFNVAIDWLRQRGLTHVRGPIDYYNNEPQGLLVDGFDSIPPVNLYYHPPYYQALFEANGFYKQADLYAYEIPDFNQLPFHKGEKFVNRVTERQGIRFRPVNLNDIPGEAAIAVKLINEFEQVNGDNFIPVTLKDALLFYKALKPILEPELVYFAEHQGETVGFVCTVPDVNECLITVKEGRLLPTGIFKLLGLKRRSYRRLRVVLLGMQAAYQKTGLGPALCYKALSHARQRGFQAMDMSMIHECNQLMLNTCKRLGGQVYKTYRVYEKVLTYEA